MATTIQKFLRDSELLQTEFRVRDPLNSVEGLLQAKPDPAASPKIVGTYDETPSGGRLANPDEPFIWCCHCQKYTHWRGYVLEDGSDDRFTIGNNCGHDHYGTTFDFVVKTFNEKRARQGVLRAFLRLLAKIDGLEDEIESILQCTVLKAHDRKRDEMFRASRHGFEALKKAATRGSLTAIQKTRNFDAENEREARFNRAVGHYQSLPTEERLELRDAGLKPEFEDEPIIDSKAVDFGFVVGTSLLGIGDPRRDTIRLRDALVEIRKIEGAGTDSFASKPISTARRKLAESAADLRKSMISTSFAETFFEQTNLDRIEEWSKCFRDFAFYTEDGVLFAMDDGKGPAEISHISMTGMADTPILEHIHYSQVEDKLVASGDAVFADPNRPSSQVYV